MKVPGRVHATAFLFLLFGGAPAAGQPLDNSLLVSPDQGPQYGSARPRLEFRAPEGDLRRAGEPRRNGLIAAFPLREDVEIGIGRFTVMEIARPRTHMEADRNPTGVRSRDRGIAAIGVSLRF